VLNAGHFHEFTNYFMVPPVFQLTFTATVSSLEARWALEMGRCTTRTEKSCRFCGRDKNTIHDTRVKIEVLLWTFRQGMTRDVYKGNFKFEQVTYSWVFSYFYDYPNLSGTIEFLPRKLRNKERGAGNKHREREKWKMGTKLRIGNKVCDRARVQVRFCSHFHFPFSVLVPRSPF